MFYNKLITKAVYNLYIEGICISIIAYELGMDEETVNEIIDYVNEVYI